MLIDSYFQGAPPIPATFQSHKWSPNAHHQKPPVTSHHNHHGSPHYTTGKPPCLTLSFGFTSWEKTFFGKKENRARKKKMKKWFVSFRNGGNFVPSVFGHNDGCRKSEQAQRSQNLNQSTLQSTFFSFAILSHSLAFHQIGFNPWEFLKNIANVASDLNKSKKIC